jgi:hypothetical protein
VGNRASPNASSADGCFDSGLEICLGTTATDCGFTDGSLFTSGGGMFTIVLEVLTGGLIVGDDWAAGGSGNASPAGIGKMGS